LAQADRPRRVAHHRSELSAPSRQTEMARPGVLSVAALALAAVVHGAHPAAPAVAGRQLQQNQNEQPAYCEGITPTNFEGSEFDYDNTLGTSGGRLTYYNVARMQDGSPVNLVVTNSTPYYPPTIDNPPATGIVGNNVGQIGLNMNPDQRAQGECFNFHYENRNSGQNVDFGRTILTFMDVDNLNSECREVYRICDSTVEFLTSPNAALTRTSVGVEGSGDCTDIYSSRTDVTDPTNTHSLTDDQAASGFGVRFSDSLNICMRLEGENCDNLDRQFNFGGLSNIDNCREYGYGSSTSSGGTSGSGTSNGGTSSGSGTSSGGSSFGGGSTSGATGGGTGGSPSNGGTSGGTATSSSGSSFGGGAASSGGSTATASNGGGAGGAAGTGPGAASNGGAGAGTAPAACGSTCTYEGRTSTCQDLVRGVQRGEAGGESDSMQAGRVACANAWAVVVDECKECRDCGRDYACQGLFEVGAEVLPRAAPQSRATTFAVAGLAACLAAAAAVLGLARGQRLAPAATAEGLEEAGPAQPLVDEPSA